MSHYLWLWNKFTRSGIVGLLGLAAILLAPVGFAAPLPDVGNLRIIAIVNDQPITEYDILCNVKYQLLLKGQIKDGEPVSAEMLNAMGMPILRQLIQNKLILQELARRKIEVSDAEIKNSIADFEQSNQLKPGTILGVLERNKLPERIVFDQERAQIGWPRAVSRRIQAASRVSDSDVDAALNDIKANIGKSEYLISEIDIIKKSDESVDDQHDRAEHVLKRLNQDADFARLAKSFSDSSSAYDGGDLGWLRQDQLDPNIAKIINNLAKNAVSGIIETKMGLAIVKLRDKRENKNSGAELSREQLENRLFMQRLNSEGRSYLRELQFGAIIDVKNG